MGESISNTRGFTLVEISIVMIIIGLLIGGTFGGMKLVENMQVNKAVQDLKAIESAALTFKDSYGRLPGDIANPSTRLPNCSVAPCATGGNANRVLDYAAWDEVLTATMEKYTFWHHLQAADLIGMDFSNTTTMDFGEGQPEAPFDAGYRIQAYNGNQFGGTAVVRYSGAAAMIVNTPSGVTNGTSFALNCKPTIEAIDRKIDDGQPYEGRFAGYGCSTTVSPTSTYDRFNSGAPYYDLKGF